MFKKSLMALIIATIAAASMTSAAFAKKFRHGGWGHKHHHYGHHVKIYVPTYYGHSCHYYKNKWKWTGKKYWYKKYKTCLYYND